MSNYCFQCTYYGPWCGTDDWDEDEDWWDDYVEDENWWDDLEGARVADMDTVKEAVQYLKEECNV